MKKLMMLIAALFGGSAQAAETLPDILIAIDAQLREKRPDYAALLRPPLSPEEISALEATYALSLPDDVKALYMWHDGQDPQSSDSFANNLMFEPLAQILSTKAELDGMIGHDFELANWWHPAWLPVFQNGGGDHLVVDMDGIETGTEGQMLTAYHDWDYRPIEAPSLLTYMSAVLAYYQSTPADALEEPFPLEGYLSETGKSFSASGKAIPLQK